MGQWLVADLSVLDVLDIHCEPWMALLVLALRQVDQEINGSGRACNACNADRNADTRGGMFRVPSQPGIRDSTVLAWPSCISWSATRPK